MKRFYDFLDRDPIGTALLVGLAFCATMAVLTPACSTAMRQRELGYTLSGLVAAQGALDSYEGPHELEIVRLCTPDDKAGCEAKVHAFQASRDKARQTLKAALDLVGAAYKTNTDPAVATAEATAAAAYSLLKALGVSL